MGQKVHPEAMRVGYIHDWKSNWFSEKNFSDFLIEDVRIRDHITNKLAHAGLSDITIRKDAALVKDNHVLAAGGVAAAFAAVRALEGTIPVEIEVDSLEGLAEALDAGADV